MKPKTITFLVLIVLLVGLDQATKIWIFHNVEYQREAIEIIPGWLQIVHVQNRGAAFGMLNNYEHRMGVFLVFTLVAVGAIFSIFRELEDDDRFMSATLAFIMSGAVGNGIDRAWRQAVVDFIRFYTDHPTLEPWLRENFGTNEYPSFNVADIAICTGVGLFLFYYLFLEDRESEDPLSSEEIPPEDEGVEAPSTSQDPVEVSKA